MKPRLTKTAACAAALALVLPAGSALATPLQGNASKSSSAAVPASPTVPALRLLPPNAAQSGSTASGTVVGIGGGSASSRTNAARASGPEAGEPRALGAGDLPGEQPWEERDGRLPTQQGDRERSDRCRLPPSRAVPTAKVCVQGEQSATGAYRGLVRRKATKETDAG